MVVRRCADAEELLARAGTFLEAREAEHNLMLGLLGGLRDDPRPYGHDAYLAVVEDAAEVVGAAVRTPPFGPVLSELEQEEAAARIAEDMHHVFPELPGVLGPREAAARFAAAWERLAAVGGRIAMEERIYRAETVSHPADVAGAMRGYEPRDRELAVEWLRAFAAEAQSQGTPGLDAAEWLDHRVSSADGGVVLWDDAESVSLAGYGNPTPSGIRIGPVYTPPERRRRGYASALTAALTERLLAGGRRFCFLFTDLANPASNSIYQQVGYHAVSDVDQWVFEPATPFVGRHARSPL